MFIEKYRPNKFDEVIGQDSIIKVIKKFIEKEHIIPNLLFSGDAGTGKTSVAIIIAREIFGADWKNSLLELNASSERGIDVIRGKVKEFARTKGFGKYKIVFLDEASEITKDAQHALRRMMEIYSDNCRFILSCNYINKVIEPIISRCSICHFKKIDKKDMEVLAKRVIQVENIKIKKNQFKLIIMESNGDARRLLHLLEAKKNGADLNDEIIEDVFSLNIGEFANYAYKMEPEYLFKVMTDEAIENRNMVAVLNLAECDMRMRLGCVKSLQLISAFIKIKKNQRRK